MDWIEQDASVLDLGCGNGELLSRLIEEKQVRAQGIEINQQAIHRCVARGLSVFQEDIDTGLSEYAGEAFDYVVLNQTFQQVKKPAFVLEAALRVGKKTIVGFPSTYYPVFVNIIDNAIFWLKDRPLPRRIVLDADDAGFSISNNGPEISMRDREIIFDRGFTRKPNGRGLGLHISREVLSKVGYQVYAVEPQLGQGVTFRIEPIRKDDEESEEE